MFIVYRCAFEIMFMHMDACNPQFTVLPQSSWICARFIRMKHFFNSRANEAYLKASPNYNFQMYRQIVHELTETFRKISEEVISISKTLGTEPHNLQQIQTIIGKIQEEEKSKLDFVSIYHLDTLTRDDQLISKWIWHW